MKIALYHNLPSGGARRAMVAMAKELVSRGHVIDEYCPDTADLSFLPLDGYARRITQLRFRPLGVARRRIPMLTPLVTTLRLSIDLRTLANIGRAAAEIICQRGYDVVFSHDCKFIFVPDIVRFAKLPTVHYCHAATSLRRNEVTVDGTPQRRWSRLKKYYYAPIRMIHPTLRLRRALRNLRAAQVVLTNSRFAAEELRDSSGIEPIVCYLGVDVECFRPLGLSRDPFVVAVGAVHYHKGYRFLIRALAALPEGRRPALVIAANHAEPSELEAITRLAADLGVNLTICHMSDDSEMVRLYNQASAFICAPIDEPWGLAATEAMACGTPVVAVGEGGLSESVVHKESGLLTEADPRAFASALLGVLADPKLAKRLGEGGIERVRSQFTWTATVDRLEGHFQEIAAVVNWDEQSP